MEKSESPEMLLQAHRAGLVPRPPLDAYDLAELTGRPPSVMATMAERMEQDHHQEVESGVGLVQRGLLSKPE